MINYQSKLKELLGKLFVCNTFSYIPAEVVQIVGWSPTAEKENAKIRYVYVKYIELDEHHDMYGGSSKINMNNIDFIEKPMKTATKLQIHFEDNDPFLHEPFLSKGNSRSGDYQTFFMVDLSNPTENNFKYINP